MNSLVRNTCIVTVLTLSACGSKQPVEEVPQAETQPMVKEAAQAKAIGTQQLLETAATGPHRSAENIVRNDFRHPVETLKFFGMEPDMTVVELWPGGGWYSEVIAPALPNGTLVAASYAPNEDPEHYRSRGYKAFAARLENEAIFANTKLALLDPPNAIDLGEAGSADLVVTFRNTHSWIQNGLEQETFAAVAEVLKPGGTFGVVQHRAAEGANPQESAKKGYVSEAYVIELATNAGLELVEKSEINANPKDTKDYAEGVWTLPPSYRLKDVDRAKYEAIGESDRMTLKFRKPAE